MQYLTVSQAEKKDAIRQTSYFSDLDEALVEKLSTGTSLRCYQRGEELITAGDP
jgi:signal-transduction protein with cAMP-binding, CBS, and nucleotidyltransferase domain